MTDARIGEERARSDERGTTNRGDRKCAPNARSHACSTIGADSDFRQRESKRGTSARVRAWMRLQ
jgi:hypothetical protein